MKLIDAILSEELEDRDILIEYRTVLPKRFDCTPPLTGLCKLESGFLLSLDGNYYSTQDIINGFKYDSNQDILIVYVEAKWN